MFILIQYNSMINVSMEENRELVILVDSLKHLFSSEGKLLVHEFHLCLGAYQVAISSHSHS